jgi:WD40 repeat protein
VRLLDALTGHEVLVLPGAEHHSAALHPNEELVVTTGGGEHDGGKVSLWHVETGQLAFEFTGHSNTILGAGFSRDGSRLATAGADGSVRIWDFATQQEILNLPHGGEVSDVVFGGPNDETLVSSSGSFFFSGYSRIWRAPPYVPKKK